MQKRINKVSSSWSIVVGLQYCLMFLNVRICRIADRELRLKRARRSSHNSKKLGGRQLKLWPRQSMHWVRNITLNDYSTHSFGVLLDEHHWNPLHSFLTSVSGRNREKHLFFQSQFPSSRCPSLRLPRCLRVHHYRSGWRWIVIVPFSRHPLPPPPLGQRSSIAVPVHQQTSNCGGTIIMYMKNSLPHFETQIIMINPLS